MLKLRSVSKFGFVEVQNRDMFEDFFEEDFHTEESIEKFRSMPKVLRFFCRRYVKVAIEMYLRFFRGGYSYRGEYFFQHNESR